MVRVCFLRQGAKVDVVLARESITDAAIRGPQTPGNISAYTHIHSRYLYGMQVSCVLRGTGATPDDSGVGECCVAKRAVYFSRKDAPVPNPPTPAPTTPDRTAESEGGMCCWQTHPQLIPPFRLTVNPAASAVHRSPAKSASSRASQTEGSPAASAEDGSPAKSASSRTSNTEGEAAAGVQEANYAEELVEEFTSAERRSKYPLCARMCVDVRPTCVAAAVVSRRKLNVQVPAEGFRPHAFPLSPTEIPESPADPEKLAAIQRKLDKEQKWCLSVCVFSCVRVSWCNMPAKHYHGSRTTHVRMCTC